MDNPEQEIRAVVRSLCQGKPDEQRRTLDKYFTLDASFVHPFCIVPSFAKAEVPLLGTISSRDVLRSIFQWYRMLSPRIEIEIDSVLYDHARDRLYLDMRQIFCIWFIPFHRSPVRLVTVLDLVSDEDPQYAAPLSRLVDISDGPEEKGDEEEGRKELVRHQQHHMGTLSGDGHKTWKIAKQEDLYQVNEFLKFAGTGLFASAWGLFQLWASAICVFMSLFVGMSPWAFQNEPARGGVEAKITQLVDEADRSDEDDVGEGRASVKPRAEGEGSQHGGGGGGTNGTRRASANSKASSSHPPPSPKKTWKHQKKGGH